MKMESGTRLATGVGQWAAGLLINVLGQVIGADNWVLTEIAAHKT